MNRRSFLSALVTSAAGLALPYEPKRVYSFLPGERRWWMTEDEDFVCRKIRRAASEIETLHARISERYRWVVKSATREGVITMGLEQSAGDYVFLAGDHPGNITVGWCSASAVGECEWPPLDEQAAAIATLTGLDTDRIKAALSSGTDAGP